MKGVALNVPVSSIGTPETSIGEDIRFDSQMKAPVAVPAMIKMTSKADVAFVIRDFNPLILTFPQDWISKMLISA